MAFRRPPGIGRAPDQRAGYSLRERLPVYPEFILERSECFDPEMLRRLRAACDSDGYPTVPEES